MIRFKKTYIVQYSLVFTLLLSTVFSQIQTTIGEGLSEQELLDYVITNYKTSTTLGYNGARDKLYGEIDIHDGNQLSCVYTGYTITIDDLAYPRNSTNAKGINCEHTWPQSMGAADEPQRSDMHHLFPCKDNVNSSRGNDPYAEIPDANTDKWFRLDYYQTTIPTENIDEYSEKENNSPERFEPREDHKGNAARAVFYFYSMYQYVANSSFWEVQKNTMSQWNYYDPVDQKEYDRSLKIASYQDNKPNPFVLDSTLARRIWFIRSGAPELVINEIMQDPSAVSDDNGEWFEIVNIGSTEVNLNGWTIKDNDIDSHLISGSVIVPVDGFVVLGKNSDSLSNGGVFIDYEYSGIILANSDDELILISPDGDTVDYVAWDDGISFPDPTGASMALISSTLDNSVGSNWVESTTPFGAGDYGTPGSANFPVSIADNTPKSPTQFSLYQSYPNPFNPVTTISYQLPKSGFVNLSIYNTKGQLIETLINRRIQSGYHSVKWDGSFNVSGVYFYRISAGDYSATGKCILLK
ncbi:MAG: endonuclease [Candidatus Marinimicrobia bacterium]|nr:endonuclease [Candidatus Neomarinimicrobiota bacterium]